jgi:hypothetical protein
MGLDAFIKDLRGFIKPPPKNECKLPTPLFKSTMHAAYQQHLFFSLQLLNTAWVSK